MTNSESITAIANKAGLTEGYVKLVIGGLSEVLKEAVTREGDPVELKGLGSFKRRLVQKLEGTKVYVIFLSDLVNEKTPEEVEQ